MGNTNSSKHRHASGEDMVIAARNRFDSNPTSPTSSTSTSGLRFNAESERCDIPTTQRRVRANTLTPGQEPSADVSPPSSRLLPTVFKWEGGGKDVYISGSFNNWKGKIPLVKSHGDFYTILDLPEGDHQYKFHVDGQWLHSPNEPVSNSDIGTQNNLVRVKRSDFDAFEALAIDGRAAAKKDVYSNEYSTAVPPRRGDGKHTGPPFLPPQLMQVPLNRDTAAHIEPSLLPEPNHVMLNHLYALSIKDSVMVLSATHRFRKKYVTTLLYKPLLE